MDRQTVMMKQTVLFAICKRAWILAFGFQDRRLLQIFRSFLSHSPVGTVGVYSMNNTVLCQRYKILQVLGNSKVNISRNVQFRKCSNILSQIRVWFIHERLAHN
jgi:hypothetical protein